MCICFFFGFSVKAGLLSTKMTTLPKVLVICGPSGCGKSTLITKLMKAFPGQFGFSVSHTTRGPRTGEAGGEHYHFVSKDLMKEKILAGQFLEHAEVHGNLYGTSFDAIRHVADAGKICILDIDVQGVESIKEREHKLPAPPKYLMIVPPSVEILETRLRGRSTDSEESIAMRVENAKREIQWASKPAGFWAKVLINDDIVNCFNEFVDFVVANFGTQKAE